MKKIIGYYNELEYSVVSVENENNIGDPDGNNSLLYRAGNSPFDSQAYVNATDGVGLDKMKAYCEQTSREIATELGLEFAGIEYEEINLPY